MAFTYQPDLTSQAGVIVTANDPNDGAKPTKQALAPAFASILTDGSGNAAGTAGNPLVVSQSASGTSNVQGNQAAGTTETSNPVTIGGLVNSTPPTVSAGQRQYLWMTPGGAAVASFLAVTQTLADQPSLNIITSPNGLPAGSVTYGYVYDQGGTGWFQQRGSIQGTYTVSKASNNLATGQVSVTTTATQIVAARATGRGAVTITNTGTTDVFVGAAGVTTTTGHLLPGTKGASVTIPAIVAIFAIVATGTQTVTYLEVA